MSRNLEVPQLADLAELSIEIRHGSEQGVVSLTASKDERSEVCLTWDEIASSVTVRWLEDAQERLRLEWELVSKVSVLELEDALEFHVLMHGEGLQGQLIVHIGESIQVDQSLLRS